MKNGCHSYSFSMGLRPVMSFDRTEYTPSSARFLRLLADKKDRVGPHPFVRGRNPVVSSWNDNHGLLDGLHSKSIPSTLFSTVE